MKVRQFHEACSIADWPAVESLLRSCPSLIDCLDCKTGLTPLARAIVGRDDGVAKVLLEHGADPNSKTALGDPPLHLAVESAQEGLVRLLLEFAADPNCANSDGRTPLHLATLKGHLALMELLLSAGALPDAKDHALRTPMHLALSRGLNAAVTLLYRYSASPLTTHKAGPSLSLSLVSPKDLLEQEPTGRSTLSQDLSDRSFTSCEKRRNCSQELSCDLDHINHKIISVLSANDALPPAVSTEATSVSFERQNASVHISLTRDPALSEWLHDLRLDEICERLLDSGFDDLDEMLEQQRSGVQLTAELLSDIGVEKPGHRYVLLAALELESSATVKETRPAYSCLSRFASGAPTPSLEKWLESLNLDGYAEAFRSSGFEHFEQVLALMKTSYKVTEEMLEKDVGVKKLGHRHRMLGNIQELAQDVDPERLLFTSGRRHSSRSDPGDAGCALM